MEKTFILFIILTVIAISIYLYSSKEHLILNSFPTGIKKTYIQPSTILNGCRQSNAAGPISLGMYEN